MPLEYLAKIWTASEPRPSLAAAPPQNPAARHLEGYIRPPRGRQGPGGTHPPATVESGVWRDTWLTTCGFVIFYHVFPKKARGNFYQISKKCLTASKKGAILELEQMFWSE